jgi:hypothetical protein
MNIFESLENLNVSEECFDEIMELVEELLSEKVQDTIDKKYDMNPEKGQFYSKAYQDYKDAEAKGDPSAEEKYKKWDRGIKLSAKVRNMQAETERQKRAEGKPTVDERTKGERNQRAADYRNPRYSGKNGMYIKDRRAQQDAESGYNVAINKAVRRHDEKKS